MSFMSFDQEESVVIYHALRFMIDNNIYTDYRVKVLLDTMTDKLYQEMPHILKESENV